MVGECLEGLRVFFGGKVRRCHGGVGRACGSRVGGVGPTGTLTAFDRDPASLAVSRQRLTRFGDRVRCVAGNFDRFDERGGIPPHSIDGILADLGVSSPQLDQAERGFSLCGRDPGHADGSDPGAHGDGTFVEGDGTGN
jgi:16S rRNA (cytosine1402-N4)-methyltransferase